MENKPFCREETILQLIVSNSFWYQPYVAFPGSLGEKISVFDDVLLSHKLKIFPNISIDENCIEFEFQTDRI